MSVKNRKESDKPKKDEEKPKKPESKKDGDSGKKLPKGCGCVIGGIMLLVGLVAFILLCFGIGLVMHTAKNAPYPLPPNGVIVAGGGTLYAQLQPGTLYYFETNYGRHNFKTTVPVTIQAVEKTPTGFVPKSRAISVGLQDRINISSSSTGFGFNPEALLVTTQTPGGEISFWY